MSIAPEILPVPTLTENAGVIARADTGIVLASPLAISSALQPIADVARYLETRKPVPHFNSERALWLRLPSVIAKEVRAKLDAFDLVNGYVRARISVTRACTMTLSVFSTWNWKLKTFRAQYDLWMLKRDWFVLVNRTKCGAAFQVRKVRLPEAFIKFVAQRCGEFKRSDAKMQAVLSIHRQWATGRNPKGDEEVIPGYEFGWSRRNRAELPPGWSYDNLLIAVKKLGKFTPAAQAFLHEGESAAREHLPFNLGTRAGLRFLELVTFDDVRTDWLILNEASGQAEELWLLLARDTATAMVLGFVMHPATVRQDGSAVHLGLRQMKQLAGWMLERYPLPPYVVTWKIERGTATLSEGMRLALGELFGHRIAVSFTSMIGASASPAGYAEKKKGNSRGKASHESHNRLLHTQGAFIAGQSGNRWEVRPADLNARAREAGEIWQMRERLPEHLRGSEKYPLLTLNQAREHLFRITDEQNARTDHKLEGFEEVIERIGDKLVKRMEQPIERAARLVKGFEWTPVAPDIVRAFYEHTERRVTVKPNGEIDFQHDGRGLIFRHGGVELVPGTKALAYFHPDDPKFLHLTDGQGATLGTWIRRERVGHLDNDALAAAMRYTHLARETARAAANELAAPERAQLEAMRAHNAELMQLAQFTDVTAAPNTTSGTIGSPVGAALTTVSAAVKSDSAAARRREEAEGQRAMREILATGDDAPANTNAAEELLAALREDSAADQP